MSREIHIDLPNLRPRDNAIYGAIAHRVWEAVSGIMGSDEFWVHSDDEISLAELKRRYPYVDWVSKDDDGSGDGGDDDGEDGDDGGLG